MGKRFRKGDVLTAAELMGIRRRVELLRMRGRRQQQMSRTVQVVESRAMRYGFQLAHVGGALCVRCGFLWDGKGGLVSVGEGEWNAVEVPEGLEAFDVWLQVTIERGGKMSGEVVVAARDASVPSGRLRVRLGFQDYDAAGNLRRVQSAGGLINPYQPVMARGSVRSGSGVASGSDKAMRRSDHQMLSGRCAGGGVAQANGYTIDPWGQTMRSDFFLYYFAGLSVMDARKRTDGKQTEQRVLRFDNTVILNDLGQY